MNDAALPNQNRTGSYKLTTELTPGVSDYCRDRFLFTAATLTCAIVLTPESYFQIKIVCFQKLSI